MKKYFTLLTFTFLLTQISAQNIGIGTTNPTEKLSVGGLSQFQVDSFGNIKRINDVSTNFPAWQGNKNDLLRNDGNGNFSWQKLLPIGTIVQSDYVNPELDSMGFALESVSEQKGLAYYRGMDDGNWIDSAITPPASITNVYEIGNATMIGAGSTKFAFYQEGYIYMYNIVSGAWTTSNLCTISDFATTRKGVKIVCVGTVIYCIGGYTNLASAPFIRSHNTVAAYNNLANTWSATPSLPDSISDAGVCENNGIIYVMYGGKKKWNAGQGFYSFNNQHLYSRNITSGGPWITVSNFSTSLKLNPTICRTNNYFFIEGGQNDNEEYVHSYPEKYDVANGFFSYGVPTNTARCVAICKKGTDTACMSFANTINNNHYIYQTTGSYTKSIKNATGPTRLFNNIASTWYGGSYYIFGIDHIYKYTPNAGIPEPVFAVPNATRERYSYIKEY
jgi:Kelch motif